MGEYMIGQEKISVIIPVYNVENYLRDCLDSVLYQTFEPYEIIVVDDGSTDGSGAVCDEYAGKDPRIRVVHGRNRGLSAARNTGIELASGDYFAFLDSDDQLHPDYLNILIQLIRRYDVDLAACDFIKAEKPEKADSWGGDDRVEIRRGNDVLEKMNQNDVVVTVAWNKLYDRKFFKEYGLRYPEGKCYEDMYLTPQILYCSRTMVLTGRKLYFYRQRPDSITGSAFSLKKMDALESIEFRIRYFDELHRDALKYAEYESCIRKIRVLYRSMKDCGEDRYRSYMELLKRKAAEILQNRDVMLHISWKYRIKLAVFLIFGR